MGLCAALVVALGAGCATTAPAESKDEPKKQARTKRPGKRPTPAPIREAPPVADAPVAIQKPPPPLLIAPPQDLPPPELGLASYYADSLAGNRTANGERYRPEDKTCAHRKHKFGTRLIITDVDTGKSVRCRVNDRGPYVNGRIIDVSRSLADQLNMRKRGLIRVRVEVEADGTGS